MTTDTLRQHSRRTPRQPEYSPIGERILARVGIEPPVAPKGQGAVEPPPPPKELEVDVGGAKRRVTMDQLVKSFVQSDEVERVKQDAERRLAELGDLGPLKALQGRLASMPPGRRAKFLEMLTSDDGGDAEPATADDIAATAFGEHPRSPEPHGDLVGRLERAEQVIQALAAEANGRFRETRHKTIEERVEGLMGQFPVFQSEGAASKFAKETIVNLVASDPTASDRVIEAHVAKAAQRLTEFVTRQRQQANEEMGVPPTLKAPQTAREKAARTAVGMRSGLTRELASEHLKRVLGG